MLELHLSRDGARTRDSDHGGAGEVAARAETPGSTG